jgi:predicted Zn-dependent protease
MASGVQAEETEEAADYRRRALTEVGMGSRDFIVVLALLTGMRFASLPARAEEPKVVKPLYNTFSDEEEMAMGRNAAQETEKQYQVLPDTILDVYLQHLGQKVAGASSRPQLKYHFKVVDTAAVNAFSLPGGYVYVHRGLLEFVETESELVGVVAHEVAHIVAYHSMNDVARRWLVDRLVYEGKKAGLVDDQQIQDVLERYGGPVLLFVDRKFSREEENEADLLGLYNAPRAGWDPQGLITFLSRLSQFASDPGLTELLLRRHPLPGDRVDALRAELKQYPPRPGLSKTSVTFRGMKARLKLLPPPPEPETR